MYETIPPMITIKPMSIRIPSHNASKNHSIPTPNKNIPNEIDSQTPTAEPAGPKHAFPSSLCLRVRTDFLYATDAPQEAQYFASSFITAPHI